MIEQDKLLESNQETNDGENAYGHELDILQKMRVESVRKFKEKFPNGATLESWEFLE